MDHTTAGPAAGQDFSSPGSFEMPLRSGPRHVGAFHYRAVAGNPSIETQLHGGLERVGPLDARTACGIINERRAIYEQIAGVQHVMLREKNQRITIGVPATEVLRAHLFVAEK